MQHVCRITEKWYNLCTEEFYDFFLRVVAVTRETKNTKERNIPFYTCCHETDREELLVKREPRGDTWWHVLCVVRPSYECVKRTGPKLTRFVLFVNLKRSRFLERNGYVITCTWKRVIKNRNQKSRFADL